MNKANIFLGLSLVVLVGSSAINYMLFKELKSLKTQGSESKEGVKVNDPMIRANPNSENALDGGTASIDSSNDFSEEPTPSRINILSRNGLQPSSSDNLTFYPRSSSVSEQRPSFVIDQNGKAFFFSGTQGVTIDDGSVSSGKIASGAISGEKIANNSIEERHIKEGQVTGTNIAQRTITSDDIGENTIKGLNIENGTIKNQNIATDAISSDKIVNGTIKVDDLGLEKNSLPSETIKSIKLLQVESVAGNENVFVSCPDGSSLLSGTCYTTVPSDQMPSHGSVRSNRGHIGIACSATGPGRMVMARAICIVGIPTTWEGVRSVPPGW